MRPLLLALVAVTVAAAPLHRAHRPPCFRTPRFGLFTQENASTSLPGPGGQHPAFGATTPWADIRSLTAACAPRCRLLFLVRHGQADSNVVQARVGPAAWEGHIGRKCRWRGATLLDAALTATGRGQAAALAASLARGGLANLTAGLPPPTVVASPLTRTLHTAALALAGVLPPSTNFTVAELARERVGVNTCDARSPATDGGPSPCGRVKHGLRSSWSSTGLYGGFPIVRASWWRRHHAWRPPAALGLTADADVEWGPRHRESDAHLAARADALLATVWRDTPAGAPVFIVSHSGLIPGLLAAVGRQPYPPQNAELVPALVEEC